MNIQSVIKLLPENKEQIANFTVMLRNLLDSGEVNPFEILICIKGFEKVIENIKPLLIELSIDEYDKYSEKEVIYKGVKLVKKEAGTKYDFSNCGDVHWERYNSDIILLTNSKKERESFLKTIENNLNIIDQETGEVYELFPPSKKSTTTISVSI